MKEIACKLRKLAYLSITPLISGGNIRSQKLKQTCS